MMVVIMWMNVYNVELEILTMVTVNWDTTPCNLVYFHRRFEGSLGSKSEPVRKQVPTLKMWVICSSKTSVDIYRTTRRYFPEDCTLQFMYYPDKNEPCS
jgi:hypothetical protein